MARNGSLIMDAAYKTKWLEALRSGKYAQDTDYLKTKNGYCCLGVLADVAGIDSELKSSTDIYGFDFEGNGNDYTEDLELPLDFLLRMDLSRSDTEELVDMNDERGNTFAEIADYIEENL